MINVLVIAEDLLTRRALREAVVAEGGQPVVAASYQDALGELSQGQYPLILAPLTLGSISGGELCSGLRATHGGAVSVIVAHPQSEHDVPRTLVQDGFDGFLRMPLDALELAFHVQSAARRLDMLNEMRRLRTRGEVLRQLSLELAWSTTVEQQARHALEAALKLVPATRGAVWLRDRDQELLRCLYTARLSPRYSREAAGLLAFTSQDQWLELTRGPLVVENLRAQSGKPGELARAEGFDTTITVALFTPARIVGALLLYLDEGVQPTTEELDLVETVAAVTAMAFDQAQLHADFRAAHHTYRELVEQLPSGAFIHDAQGNFLVANAALQAMCGYDAEQFQLLDVFDILVGGREGATGVWISAKIAELVNASDAEATLRGPFDIQLLRADQRVVEAELHVRAIEQHGAWHIQGLVRDVTMAMQAERRLAGTRHIAGILASERDMPRATHRVLDELCALGGYSWVALWTSGHTLAETLLAEVSHVENQIAMALRRRAVEHAQATIEPRLVVSDNDHPPLAVIPLKGNGEPLGLLAVGATDHDEFRPEDLSFIASVGAQLAPALERLHLQQELEQRAAVDPTTGLDNRTEFHLQLERAIASSASQPVSVLVVGVDEFKQINDLYGHTVGDALLRQLGQLIDAQLLPTQRVARYTSDEFAVILPATSRADVFRLAEQLRISIGMKLFTAAEQVEQLTVSIGIATFPDDAGNADRLVLAAGHALFLAKQAGRNQVYQSNEAFAELASAHGRIIDLLRQAPKETLTLLVRAMDQRLPERAGHAQRVAAVAVELGQELGLDHSRLGALRIAALAHDIGMFALPDALLRKPGKLSAAEREQVSNTPLVAHRLLSQIELPPTVLPAVVHQQERWDGAGYPTHLAGEAIPLEARIIAVADAFDALTSVRAHREQLTTDAALEILRQSAGQQFDPAVVDVALRLKSRLPTPEAVADDEIGTALHRALQLLHS